MICTQTYDNVITWCLLWWIFYLYYKAQSMRCAGCTVSLRASPLAPRSLPLLVIFCNKMAVVPESRVLTFSVFKWSSYSSTYLPE